MCALSEGRTPSGDSVREVIPIESDSLVDVWHEGGQSFGSGGFHAGAVFSGNEPEKVGEVGEGTSDFGWEIQAKFRVTAPCVLYEYAWDAIGRGGRTFRSRVYLCGISVV